ncbi:MAG: hypothetical protein Q4F31_02755 [Eubacteriales bacterium]|nr:hypothetical protein [Eubacteriales bacterium]
MKKVFSLIFSLLLLLPFSSSFCASAENDGASDQVVIHYSYENQVFFDPNEGINAILSYTCENPYVVIEDNPGAAERINSVLEPYNASYVPSDDGVAINMDRETYLLSLAEDYFSLHSEDHNGGSFLFSFSHRCSSVQCRNGLLMLAFSDYLDDIDHTAITSETFYFDLSTGEQLAESEALLRTGAFENESSGTGICGIFNEEQFASEGFAFDGLNAEAIAITDLLDTVSSGTLCFLCVSGEVKNVRLSAMVKYDQWYEKQQLWFCSRMENEALQLIVAPPTEDSAIKLIYQSGGQNIEKMISADPAGNMILSDSVFIN